MEDYKGQISSEIPDFNGVGFDHDDAHDKLRTLFGGGEAEQLVFGDGQPSPADQESIKQLSGHAPFNHRGNPDTKIFMDRARQMLEEHRATLKSLAEYLLDEGTVSREHLESFLDEKTR